MRIFFAPAAAFFLGIIVCAKAQETALPAETSFPDAGLETQVPGGAPPPPPPPPPPPQNPIPQPPPPPPPPPPINNGSVIRPNPPRFPTGRFPAPFSRSSRTVIINGRPVPPSQLSSSSSLFRFPRTKFQLPPPRPQIQFPPPRPQIPFPPPRPQFPPRKVTFPQFPARTSGGSFSRVVINGREVSPSQLPPGVSIRTSSTSSSRAGSLRGRFPYR